MHRTCAVINTMNPMMTDPYYSTLSTTLSLSSITSSASSASTVPTPPPSASPVDLPPIPELSSYGRQLDDGPPSPASPKKQKGALPAYLEPTPQIIESTHKIRPQLFHLLAPPLVAFPTRRATAPALAHHPNIYTPLPRRSQSQSMDPIRPIHHHDPSSTSTVAATALHHHYTQQHRLNNNNNNHNSNNVKKRKFHTSSSSNTPTATSITTTNINTSTRTSTATTAATSNNSHIASSLSSSPFLGQDPCTSPTLAAACASAASLHTSSSFTSSPPSSSPSSPSSISFDSHSRIKSDEDKKQVDQSMFLTKNAHIKRPRNAWIHFRCHYGQALKTQDPTLRAEEISKRASRRWSLLSENEKRPWHQLAEQEKQAHKEAFPEYRYCPKRASSTSTTSNPTMGHPSPPMITTNNGSSSNVSTPSSSPSSSLSSPSSVHPSSQQGLYRLPRLTNDLEVSRIHKKSKK